MAELAQVPGKGAGSRRRRHHIAMATYVTEPAAEPLKKCYLWKLESVFPRPTCLHSQALLSICPSLLCLLQTKSQGEGLLFCPHMLGPFKTTQREGMARRLCTALRIRVSDMHRAWYGASLVCFNVLARLEDERQLRPPDPLLLFCLLLWLLAQLQGI